MAILRLFKERVEARPTAGVFGPAARSAFRTLGLPAAAAQREVFDAASSVRLALKLGVRKTFESDAAGLFGPAAREESDVRDAVGRLSEPTQRARERIFWFHRRAAHAPAASVAELTRASEALLADGGAEALHDAALLALCGLMRLDPTLRDAWAWARAFELWRRLFECEEFWSLLVAADLKGDYEQPVNFGEVAELRLNAPRVVSAHVASRAGEAARRGKLRGAAHAFDILRGAGLPASLLREYENEVFGPAEDLVTEELNKAFAWVEGLGFSVKSAATRRNYCNEAWRKFDRLRPRLAEFVGLAGADSYATRRVFEQAASHLVRLAGSFEDAGRTPEALFVFRKARALAPHGSEELSAAGERLRALGAGEEARGQSQDEYGAALARELAEEGAPAKLFRNDPKGDKTPDSFTSSGDDTAGCLTSFFFWLAMIVSCVGLQWCGVINTRPTRTPINSLPAMNMRPNLNFNLNLNNYNIPPPLNLRQYTEPPPRSTRQRPGGKSRRQTPRETPVVPPTIIEQTPAGNRRTTTPGRRANVNAPRRE